MNKTYLSCLFLDFQNILRNANIFQITNTLFLSKTNEYLSIKNQEQLMMFISVGVCQKFEVFVQKSWVFLFLYKILLCSVKLDENKKVLP